MDGKGNWYEQDRVRGVSIVSVIQQMLYRLYPACRAILFAASETTFRNMQKIIMPAVCHASVQTDVKYTPFTTALIQAAGK